MLCPSCESEISSEAKSCPNCGQPEPYEKAFYPTTSSSYSKKSFSERSIFEKIIAICEAIYGGLIFAFVGFVAGFIIGAVLGILIYPQISIFTPISKVIDLALNFSFFLSLIGAVFGAWFYSNHV